MNSKRGTFTKGSTGNSSVTGVPFLPTEIELWVGGRFSTDETRVQFSTGGGTIDSGGTIRQNAISIYQDSTGSKTRSHTNRCINHIERVSSTLTDIIVATLVSFDNNGGGDFGFTLNFTAANANYQVHYVVRG